MFGEWHAHIMKCDACKDWSLEIPWASATPEEVEFIVNEHMDECPKIVRVRPDWPPRALDSA